MITDRHTATYQAGQNRIGHMLHRHYQDGNTFGSCPCGWAVETMGDDESARNHVVATYIRHEEGDELAYWKEKGIA